VADEFHGTKKAEAEVSAMRHPPMAGRAAEKLGKKRVETSRSED
jgi:hypothetical protein